MSMEVSRLSLATDALALVSQGYTNHSSDVWFQLGRWGEK